MLQFHVLAIVHDASATAMASFDEAAQSLARFTRLFIEPDGSFVWTGDDHDQPWQVDGNLIDRGEFLAWVELKGCCPEKQLDELLTAFGWPETPLAFQLPRRGVTLDEASFRVLAESDAGAI